MGPPGSRTSSSTRWSNTIRCRPPRRFPLSMCINEDSLKKLPADLREIVEKTMPDILDMTSAKYIQMCKDSLNKSVEIKSTAICNLPDPEVAKMRKLVAPLWDELAAKTPA